VGNGTTIELVGRQRECAAIDAVLDRAASGSRAALTLRGEAGIGKSALIAYARARAEGSFNILAASGAEFEAGLPFSTLHQLLLPILDRRRDIPEPQSRALEAAFALRADSEVDRFAVYAATLSLIASAAGERPLLCLVDDGHWVDPASFEAIRFAARRLSADSVAFILGERDDGPAPDIGGDELNISRLDGAASRALIARLAGTAAPSAPVDHVVEFASGNPLALVEMASSLRARRPIGIAEFDLELTTPHSIQLLFERRAAGLDPDARRAVTLLASAGSTDAAVIGPSLQRLGVEFAALERAAEAGVVVLGAAGVRFTHPLMWAAAYHSAGAADRRASHRALAEGANAPVERAWHRAMAADGPDDEAADDLDRAARDAGRRGSPSAESRLLVTAARLTRDPDLRARRLLAAVDARMAGSELGDVETLLNEARTYARDPVTTSEVALRSARLLFQLGHGTMLADACEEGLAALPEGNDELAASLWGLIAMSRLISENVERGMEAIAQGRRFMIEPGGTSATRLDTVEMALYVTGGDRVPAALIDRCLTSGDDEGGVTSVDEAISSLSMVGEFDRVERHLATAFARQRQRGELFPVAFNLETMAEVRLYQGRLAEAQAAAEESMRICDDVGLGRLADISASTLARVAATMGQVDHARELIRRVELWPASSVIYHESISTALGRLELGLGNPDALLGPLQQGFDEASRRGVGNPYLLGYVPDLIEAYLSCGDPGQARLVFERYQRLVGSTARRWGQAVLERSRGMLSDDAACDTHFLAAMELHGDEAPFDLGRTQIVYGHRLSAIDRAADATIYLRAALERFASIGALHWADRARSELELLGERPALHVASALDTLSPQELQVALVVARGATNRETASQLFLSVKTIEFHLRNIYRKLSVRSRTELAGLVLAGRPAAEPIPSGGYT
jgi:DNA-binding CsgD family transcriptional regulator